MKNITLSADKSLLERARDKALRERKTLNALFREWVARYVGDDMSSAGYRELMAKLSYAQPGKTFSRDELNEP